MKILITGGLGFIGSHLIEEFLKFQKIKILNLDKEGTGSNIYLKDTFSKNKNYSYEKINLINFNKTFKVIKKFMPDIIFHLAAESHVDRSISNPNSFIMNNILSSVNIMESVRIIQNKKKIKIINVSTDEVFGSLNKKDNSFKEKDRYNPRSPYSSSKASSDLIFSSFYSTYGLRVITTHTCNNFGERQNNEKFIPTILKSLISNKKIPVYGNGENIREWIYVKDHVKALIKISKMGKTGVTYNIGTRNRMSNNALIKKIINIFNFELKKEKRFNDTVKFVKDRKGHDFKYSLNSAKIKTELGIEIIDRTNKKLEKTVKWYIKKLS